MTYPVTNPESILIEIVLQILDWTKTSLYDSNAFLLLVLSYTAQ